MFEDNNKKLFEMRKKFNVIPVGNNNLKLNLNNDKKAITFKEYQHRNFKRKNNVTGIPIIKKIVKLEKNVYIVKL